MNDDVVIEEGEVAPIIEENGATEVSAEAKAEPSPAVEEVNEQDAVQKRINKLTAQKYDEKRGREAAEARIVELEGIKNTLPSEAPKLEDFDYDESKHNAAIIKYEVQQYAATQATEQKQAVADVAQKAKAADFAAKEAEFSATVKDYSETVANIPQLPAETLDAIYSLDNAPQLAHYLGKHLDVAYEVANASPIVAAVKIGQIAAALAVTAKTVTTTSAPDPVETLAGEGSSIADTSDPRLSGVTYL